MPACRRQAAPQLARLQTCSSELFADQKGRSKTLPNIISMNSERKLYPVRRQTSRTRPNRDCRNTTSSKMEQISALSAPTFGPFPAHHSCFRVVTICLWTRNDRRATLFPYATSEIGYCPDSFHHWNSGRAAYRQIESGNCQRLFAGAASRHRQQAGPEHERDQLSRFRRRWRAGSAIRPPKKQIAEVCAGSSDSTGRCGNAGLWPGEAPANLRYGRRSLRSLVAAGKNVRNFLDFIFELGMPVGMTTV